MNATSEWLVVKTHKSLDTLNARMLRSLLQKAILQKWSNSQPMHAEALRHMSMLRAGICPSDHAEPSYFMAQNEDDND